MTAATMGKPPDNTSGVWRPSEVSSSPNTKNEKEATQPKKKVRPLNFDQQGVVEDITAGEMEAEESPQPERGEGKRGSPVWQERKRRLFRDVVQPDTWYVAESDTEDVVQAEKEEDEPFDDMESDPLCPTATFTAAEKIIWRREWRSALVVKGLGRKVSYMELSRRPNFLWAKHGDLQISDIKNGCFLVRFRKEDYEIATSGGSWLLGETYLTVMRWYKGFNPWKSEVSSTLIWVQLPELPIEFINKEAAMKIGSLIGNPLRVDRATEEGARGNFARVCVEVDLRKPLLSKYKVEGIEYLIQYEGLDHICMDYDKYGQPTD
ncbi:unnamed protein product [Linum trigynum]|uniref:DUF4283 domain-containing protein n=1 Tax=Linum trigynum TaxID=586398 RepID=A0AAV2GT06_9ROSI